MTEPTPQKKNLPVGRIVFLLFGVFCLAGIFGGALYLDYHSGSTSSTFFPSGMEVAAVTRGFSAGTTAVGFASDEDQNTVAIKARVGEKEFTVSETQVLLGEQEVAKLPIGAKSVWIVMYRGVYSIEVDGSQITTVD